MRIKSRKLGKYQLSYELLADIVNGTLDFKDVFKNFIVVKAEFLLASDSIEYIAYSEAFDTLAEGEIVPTYTIEIRHVKGVGPMLYNVKRVSNVL